MSELRSELWEKEMKLTDIRLEALNSAHQLDQLRETMHNMQVGVRRGGLRLQPCRPLRYPVRSAQLEVDLLKAENDRLKVAPGPSSGPAPGQAPGPAALPSPRRSLGLALAHSSSPSLTDTGTCRRGGACRGQESRVWPTATRSPCSGGVFRGQGGDSA